MTHKPTKATILCSFCFFSQNTSQDAGNPREAGQGEGIRGNPRRGQPHLQLGRGAHLRRHRLVGLVGGQQHHRPLQPPLPPPAEPTEPQNSLESSGQRPAAGGAVRPGQQAAQRTPCSSRQVGGAQENTHTHSRLLGVCFVNSTVVVHSDDTNRLHASHSGFTTALVYLHLIYNVSAVSGWCFVWFDLARATSR